MSSFLFKSVKNPDAWIMVIGVVVLCLFATGVYAQSGSIYSERGVQTSSPVTRATVLQVRAVRQEASQTARYSGMAAGGAMGAALGSNWGSNSGSGAQTALGILGGILGGAGGQAVAERVGGTVALEIIVETEASGYRQSEVIAITQPSPGPDVYEGEKVYLIQTNGTWRVIKANSAAIARQ